MQIYKITLFFLVFVLSFSFFIPSLQAKQAKTLVQGSLKKEVLGEIEKTGEVAGYPEETNIPKIVGQIISAVLAFVGLVFFVLLVYGGFLWMTAGGNEEQITKAKKFLKNGTIGIIITISAYFVTYLVISYVITPRGLEEALQE